MTTTETTEAAEHDRRERTVEVSFNLRTIRLPKERLTGLQIKQAAQDQGIQIQLSYVLFVVKNKNRRVIVGDVEQIEIKEDLVFAAVADDDNS